MATTLRLAGAVKLAVPRPTVQTPRRRWEVGVARTAAAPRGVVRGARAPAAMAVAATGRLAGFKFTGPGVGSLLGAASAFMSALGFANVTRGMVDFFNSHGGVGGGNAGDLAAAMAEYLFFPAEGSLAFSCLPCVQACKVALSHVKVRANATQLADLAMRTVRLMDAALKRHRGVSLMTFLHRRLVALANGKLAKQKWPVGWLRLRWLLPAAVVTRYGPLRKPRTLLLEWIMAEYVDYYVPQVRGRYDVATIERSLFSRYRPQLLAFLRGTDADLAPVVGFLVRHMVAYNKVHLDAQFPTFACAICSAKVMSCSQKTAAAAAAALATTAASGLNNARRARWGGRRAAARVRVPVGSVYVPRAI